MHITIYIYIDNKGIAFLSNNIIILFIYISLRKIYILSNIFNSKA